MNTTVALKSKDHEALSQVESFNSSILKDPLDIDKAARLRMAVGIFIVSGSVLAFELALTRIFSYALFSHLAFLVVRTALFGFGLSGVYLSLAKDKAREAKFAMPVLGFSLSILLAYAVINLVSFKIWDAEADPRYFITAAIWYAALVMPFFFAGITIARLLSIDKRLSSILYGIDLLGAAVGSLVFIPVISYFGASGAVFFCAAAAAFSGLILIKDNTKAKITSVVLALILFGMSFQAENIFPVKVHQSKREYARDLKRGMMYWSNWSPISRVDIANTDLGTNWRTIWIDGGTNQSEIMAVTGDYRDVKPLKWSTIATAYQLKLGEEPNVLVIGSSGGKEVLFALTHGAKHVDALEMDPSIVSYLRTPEAENFMGRMMNDPRVNMVNDEGRSFMRRQPENYYDIIQFVNNYTPIAISAGALNLSETFLATKEAVKDYYKHLSPNGVLALHRGATLRFALTAIEALRELGINSPENYILLTKGERPYFDGLFLKKTPWTDQEVERVYGFVKTLPVTKPVFLWNPFDRSRDNIYTKVIVASPSEQQKYYSSLGVDLSPASDDRPFLEHSLRIGKAQIAKEAPKEYHNFSKLKVFGLIPRGDFPYVAILVQSLIFAFIFVMMPLIIWGRTSFNFKRVAGVSGYYAALGFGFIVIEICLMKRYVLFLGNPAYSIATVVVALLASAGIGSLITAKIGVEKPLKAISIVVPAIALLVLAEAYLSPVVFANTMHFEFVGRILISCLLLFPIGVFLGMPFALGLRIIHSMDIPEDERKKVIAWAWGVNAYATVVGSALSVYIALFWGFKIALITALIAYILGLVALRSSARKLAV